MSTEYDITLCDALGRFITNLNDCVSFVAVLVENDVGTLTITVPGHYPFEWFQKDGWIKIKRSVLGRPSALIGGAVWLIRRRRLTLAADRTETITLTAVHPNHLLKRRIIAYAAGTAEAAKVTYGDNVIKAFARENMGTLATDTTRQLSTTLFSVQANSSSAPSVAKACSRDNLLHVCQEVVAAATSAGTYTGFEMVTIDEASFQLQTYTGQRGNNRTTGSFQPVILGPDYGNLGHITLDDDWSSMASFVYAGGKKEGASRDIQTAQNDTFIAESPFGRLEYFQDARNTTVGDLTQLLYEADSALYRLRPVRIFTGQIVDTIGVQFGIHYDWGDLVTAEYKNQQYDCRVNPVKISMSRANGEQIDARLRNETPVPEIAP